MDDTRIQRRTRARSYDLRRKVLLKNFLRDQMTHIPETSTESFPNPENSEESSIAEVNEQASSITVIYADTYSIPSSSEVNNESSIKNNRDDEMDLTEDIDVETMDNFEISTKCNPTPHSLRLFKFKGLLKRRRHERELENASKSVFKAKKFGKNAKSPIKTRSFKKSFEKVFYGHKKSHEKSSPNHMTKSSSRSLFSLFKHRREQRHAKDNDRTKRSSSDNHVPKNYPTKSNSINQSVQTDDSLVKYEINKVHESNMRLKEENKLLSESLSYFMSNESTPYQSPYKNENSLMFHDYTLPPSNSSQGAWNSRSKVSRSNSVHEFNERHKVLRNNYRTKSMNVHNSRNYFLTNSRRPLLSSYTDEVNTPRLRKRHILTNIPNSSSNRTIQRRSSMPERTLSENNRWVSHGRSNSMRHTHTRKPFYALSADAFY